MMLIAEPLPFPEDDYPREAVLLVNDSRNPAIGDAVAHIAEQTLWTITGWPTGRIITGNAARGEPNYVLATCSLRDPDTVTNAEWDYAHQGWPAP